MQRNVNCDIQEKSELICLKQTSVGEILFHICGRTIVLNSSVKGEGAVVMIITDY